MLCSLVSGKTIRQIILYNNVGLRPKLHYKDTGYGHIVQDNQRTPPTDELTTILQQIFHIAMPEPNISTLSRCWDVANFSPFVVNLLWAHPLVVLVLVFGAGVRVVGFGSYLLKVRRCSAHNFSSAKDPQSFRGVAIFCRSYVSLSASAHLCWWRHTKYSINRLSCCTRSM